MQEGVAAYAGAPLVTGAGVVIGSCCVISDTPRTFTDEDVATLQQLAADTVAELEQHGGVPRA